MAHEAALEIYWCNGGVPGSVEVAGGAYLGRLPGVSGGEAYTVYIISLDLRVLASLGGPYPSVSRLHARVDPGPGDSIIVRDHGPRGEGSTNGTYVNGSRLPRGGEAVVKGAAVVQLSSSGPSVLVARRGWSGDGLERLLAMLGAPACLRGLKPRLAASNAGSREPDGCVELLKALSRVAEALAATARGSWEEAEHARRELRLLLSEPQAREVIGSTLRGYLEGGVDSLLIALDSGGSALYETLLPLVKERLREEAASRGCL